MHLIRSLVILFSLAGGSVTLGQENESDSPASGIRFFEAKIRPVLVTHCYQCHSETSGKARGGLKVDTRAALLRGGETGPAIIPGSPTKSLLLTAIGYHNKDLRMPPKGKLSDQTIEHFRQWIGVGAPDPRVGKKGLVVQSKIDLEEGRKYWAYQRPLQPELPTIRDTAWPRTDIDRYILAGLESKRLTPGKDADAPILVRRLYFVLIGLPPTPEEVKQWTARIQKSQGEKLDQKEIAKLVDSLLLSPRFGERWGRHWMDVARFAESTGGGSNNIHPHAWRYRDYIIDSFNEDKPFDRFIQEQLAGDLLPIENDREWAKNVVATGFLATGMKLVGEEDQPKFFADLVDEQVDATTRAFLATTVACARCHDHKFDPIPQTDYYALAGIFRSTATHYGLIPAQARQATTLLDLTGLGLVASQKPLAPEELAKLIRDRDATRADVNGMMAKIRAGENVFRGALRRARSRRDEAEAALQGYDEKGNPHIFAMGAQDRDFPLPTRLLVRGELDKPGQVVPRGVLQPLAKTNQAHLSETVQGSGRLVLAKWIASADNPLTARVITNRVWHWLFGQGLVRTLDDFGKTGERPTHPELLDDLALRLVKNHWSLKSLIREIVLSRTWQLSSDFDQDSFSVDPNNRYLWRMSKRRLEAEAIRDAMLSVSGRLSTQRPLGTLLTSVGEGAVGQGVFEPEIRKLDSNHRSVYLPRVRNVLPESMELFDAPDASLVLGARETTSTPLQALYLMNHPLVREQADGFADRVMRQPAKEQIDFAHVLAFGRKPTPTERAAALDFAKRIPNNEWLAIYCQALLCTTEFRTID